MGVDDISGVPPGTYRVSSYLNGKHLGSQTVNLISNTTIHVNESVKTSVTGKVTTADGNIPPGLAIFLPTALTGQQNVANLTPTRFRAPSSFSSRKTALTPTSSPRSKLQRRHLHSQLRPTWPIHPNRHRRRSRSTLRQPLHPPALSRTRKTPHHPALQRRARRSRSATPPMMAHSIRCPVLRVS